MRRAVASSFEHGAAIVMTVPILGRVAADKNGGGDVNKTPDYLNQRFLVSLPKKDGPFADTPDLADGKVLRFSCTALPDGGRMLSYTPVTDLVRHADDPARADYYRSLRGGSDRTFARHMRAAE